MKPHEQAQQGLELLKEVILEILAQKSDGLRNAEIAELLGIRSDYQGEQKDYFCTWMFIICWGGVHFSASTSLSLLRRISQFRCISL
jgi:hypothetical protein